MRFNNYSRVILKIDVMIFLFCVKFFLVFLLVVFYKGFRVVVIVIDKIDCIMKDINMLILF